MSTFTVELEGRPITFSRPARYRDLKAFWNARREFVDTVFGGAVPAEWKENLPADEEEAAEAFMVHYWSTTPTRISQVESLRLFAANKVPASFEKPDLPVRPIALHYFVRELAQGIVGTAAKAEANDVEERKNDSGATDGSEFA